MGKSRGTLNQDHFKIGGSQPSRRLAARAKNLFTVDRARQRMSAMWRTNVPPWLKHPEPRHAVEGSVEPGHPAHDRTHGDVREVLSASESAPAAQSGKSAPSLLSSALSSAVHLATLPVRLGWRAVTLPLHLMRRAASTLRQSVDHLAQRGRAGIERRFGSGQASGPASHAG